MDQNKLKVLRDIGYKIQKTCGSCKHGELRHGSDFGTCSLHTYQHLKHTGELRQLSVYEFGSCDKFEEAAILPEHWQEFRL